MEPLSVSPKKVVTYDEVRTHPKVVKLIDGANEVMQSMGFTEHGHRHVTAVANMTASILEAMHADAREIELAKIAAYLHDIGNVVSRLDHPQTGAIMSFRLLDEMGMDIAEIAPILGAIGNHEELTGGPVSAMSAALIIADKSDVHYSRVQNPIIESFDIHDRVNYAAQENELLILPEQQVIELRLKIDTKQATVMEYFQIFLSRMVMSRAASERLGYRFALVVNDTYLE